MNKTAAIFMIVGATIWCVQSLYEIINILNHIFLESPVTASATFILFTIARLSIPICFLIASILLLNNKK